MDKNKEAEIIQKLNKKCADLEYGTVSVTLTIHNGEVTKIEFITSEKDILV